MPNPLFNALGGTQNATPPILQQFRQFVNQMKGRDPNQIINQMVSSGQLSQQQLNQVQEKAQQMQGVFEGMRGMFGK